MRDLIRRCCLVLEHFVGRYYEGPDAPARLTDEAGTFAMLNPHASPEEWREFAEDLARSAWQQGYVRGVEHRERREMGLEVLEDEGDARSVFDDPEALAAIEAVRANDPFAALSPEDRARALDEVGALAGTFRVVGEG